MAHCCPSALGPEICFEVRAANHSSVLTPSIVSLIVLSFADDCRGLGGEGTTPSPYRCGALFGTRRCKGRDYVTRSLPAQSPSRRSSTSVMSISQLLAKMLNPDPSKVSEFM